MKSFLKFVIMANMGDSMDFLITLDQFEGPFGSDAAFDQRK